MPRKLEIRLPAKGQLPIYFQLIWVMIMFWLRDALGFPSAITYLTDLILVYLVVMRFKMIIQGVQQADPIVQLRILLLLLCTVLLGVVINLVNPLLTLWAARNNFRFYVFFLVCIGILYTEDVDRIIKLFFGFFWANLVVCTIQYFGSGLSGDFLGGLFGTKTGSNAYINILLCLVTSVVFGRFFTAKASIFSVIIYCAACIYVAVLSEVKAFYVELIFILVISMFMAGGSKRTIFACVLGILSVYATVLVLAAFSPSTLDMLLDSDALELYLMGNGYTQGGDLNRFTAIQQIYEKFFADKPLQSVFGFGFGNCEWSQFEFIQSSFARQYNHLHYRWFTHAWVFLEQGLVGLVLLLSFFVSLFFTIQRRKKNIRMDLAIASACFISTCVFGLIYNCALQLEASYMIAFMCAIPLISSKEENWNTA